MEPQTEKYQKGSKETFEVLISKISQMEVGVNQHGMHGVEA